MTQQKIIFPTEWAEQDAVMLTWPVAGTDWEPILEEAERTYVELASEILKRERLVIVCSDPEKTARHFSADQQQHISFVKLPYNDTWARDHGPVCTFSTGIPTINDFGFNGWGNKFDARSDDQVTSGLVASRLFSAEVQYRDHRDFILEGGSLESDGNGTLLTTTACLLNPNRNPTLSRTEIEARISRELGTDRFLWLEHGHIEGDDTDSHIDILARFCDENTIAYVQCTDHTDSHYTELRKMEEQLRSFTRKDGQPYRLVPLPMVSPLYDEEGGRLGATYANFLILNGAVLLPVYEAPEDEKAVEILTSLFPGREVVPVNCLSLIRQNGSLHCVTMQIPRGFMAEIPRD